MGDEFEGAHPAVAMFLRMALANMHKRDPQASRQELIARLTESAERALEDINHASDHPGYADPCVSCVEVSSSKKIKAADSTCRSAQQKVREEVERIKNDYDHTVKKHGRGFGYLPNIAPTRLGEIYLMPSQYREINKSITAAYARLVEDAPYLPWAKVAHIVTAQFGCTMDNMADLGKWVVSHDTLNEADDAIRAIGEGNIRIFDGLYPTMRLVADLGIDQFLECAKNGHFKPKPPPKLVEAMGKLQEGNFEEAERIIIDYEQRDIAPPIYREFRQQYEFMQSKAAHLNKRSFGLLKTQSVLPVPHCSFPGLSWKDVAPVPMEGSLFNEDDRVEFYNKLAPQVQKYYGR